MPSLRNQARHRFQDVTTENAIRVARHELGHWLMAHQSGFRAGDIRIVMLDLVEGHRGSAATDCHEGFPDMPAVAQYARRRIKVLLAGALSEALGDAGTVDNDVAICELEKGGAQNDFKGARELLRLLRGIKFGSTTDEETHNAQLKSLMDEIWADARVFVELHHPILIGVGDAIGRSGQFLHQSFGMTREELLDIPLIAQLNAKQPATPVV